MLVNGSGRLRIYLARHGETIWNREGRLQGHTDVPLSGLGLAQARALADRLAHEPVTAVWTSDMQRASVTAELIAAPHGVQVTRTSLLRESRLGSWEGLTEVEISRRDADAWRAYHRDSISNRPPGGERLEEVWQRVTEALAAARRTAAAGTILVVGHGGSLRVPICEALGAPIACMRRIWLDNASLSLIEYSGDRVWVRLVNDTGHLRDVPAEPEGGASR